MLRIITITFLLLISTIGYSQDFQGKAVYQTKTSFNFDSWGERAKQMPEERKKQIMARMKSMLEKTYILDFNKSESLFKEEEKLEAPGQGGFGGMGRMMSKISEGDVYKNVKDQNIKETRDLFGKLFLINEPLKKLDWKLGSETKKIGNYTCYKATATKDVDKFDWRSMRRRRPNPEEKKDSVVKDSTQNKDLMNQIETPKTIEVVAWYTPQIPVNQGPSKYWGLPGLILEINEDKTTILCTKIVMNPNEKEIIKAPSKGKEVTSKEYTEIATKKVQEMRDMWRGRGRGGNGRGGR